MFESLFHNGSLLLTGAFLCVCIIWVALRIIGLPKEFDRDAERMWRKWLRDNKRKNDADILSEQHEER